MTHQQILMDELNKYGRVTYAELLERWGNRGYTYNGFLGAVFRAEKQGVVKGPGSGRRGGVIIRVCPCCRRPYDNR